MSGDERRAASYNVPLASDRGFRFPYVVVREHIRTRAAGFPLSQE